MTKERKNVIAKEEKKAIKIERMAYTKDKIPSWFALLAIVANVFFFVSIYKTNLKSYYTYTIGLSVLTNLLFMLAAFLCSEGVKAYKKGFGITMIVLGAIEIGRIFFFPIKGINTIEPTTSLPVMGNGQFISCVIFLSVAAAFLIAGGVISIRNSMILKKSSKGKTR